jgi:hypothetical protein
MPEVVTMVSAHIPPERIDEVMAGFRAAVRAGMPERRHTSLYRGDGGLVRIVTVWRSREDLARYLSTTDRPFVATRCSANPTMVKISIRFPAGTCTLYCPSAPVTVP